MGNSSPKIQVLICFLLIALYSCSTEDEIINYELQTEVLPENGGEVTPSKGEFISGREMIISATPNKGYVFKKWSGASNSTEKSITLKMDSDKKVIANFEKTDGDKDGVPDEIDLCADTPENETVNESGCSLSQVDTDGDTITDDKDLCPGTPEGESVDEDGCPTSIVEDDGDEDGVPDNLDDCPNTTMGAEVNDDGCSECDLEPGSCTDDDGDGISNSVDSCPDTPSGETVDSDGCSDGQKDTTPPMVVSQFARGLTATSVEIVAELTEFSKFRIEYGTVSGAYTDSSIYEESFDFSTHEKQLTDLAQNTTYYYRFEMEDRYGNKGFSEEYSITTLSLDEDEDGVNDSEDECLDTEPGVTVNANGCEVTYIPDDDFEGFLISLGHDDVLDDYVLTETIENITELIFEDNFQFRPRDFTGLNEFSSLQTLRFNWFDSASADVLDVRGLEQLQTLSSDYGPQTILLEDNISLANLYISAQDTPVSNVTTPNFEGAPNLVDVRVNEVYDGAYLDFSKNPKLKILALGDGRFSISDLSLNKLLENFIVFSDNTTFSGGLNNLDNPNLKSLDVWNFISDNERLDLSKCPSLERIFIFSSSLTGINFKNGNNQNIVSIISMSLNIECVEVDNPQFSEANWVGDNFQFPPGTIFSTDCGY